MPPISWTSKWRMPELAPADLAGGGEHLRQDVVEDVLEVLEVVLLARPAQLAAALGALVARAPRSDGSDGAASSMTSARSVDHPLADLVVGERLELGFE